MATPTVFISYSHDSESHKKWVEKLATDLRHNGIDATFDGWEIGPGDDLALFMEKGVSTANRVLTICTPNYVQKANEGEGGVGYEKMIVTAELVKNLGTKKFIPIVRNSEGEKRVPIFLGSRLYVDFDDDSNYELALLNLVHELHDQPISPKPPLGSNPFVSEVQTSPQKTVGDVVIAVNNDVSWMEKDRDFALSEFEKLNLRGFLEIYFFLNNKISTNQKDLLNAARKSQIKTFGWPIAILLENREEYKPQVKQDGIYTNIAIGEQESYDYWTIKNNGDFYLLKSLFEDKRKPDELFFNTRIVRTTEALLYCRRLYADLGVDDKQIVNFHTKYGGLKGRELTSSSSNRMLYERATTENEAQVSTSFSLSEVDENPVRIVKNLLDPIFILFNFFELSEEVYNDIVNKFINGEIT